MSRQPESRLSTQIIKKWRSYGAFAYKVHGSEHQMSGIPDISAVYAGLSVWCETKMPGNKPSPIQLHRHEQIRSAGGLVVVAYSVEEAEALIVHIESGEHDRQHICPYLSHGESGE